MICVRWAGFAAVVAATLAGPPPARADDFDWSGTAGATELWTSASNWTPDGPPTGSDKAIFDSPSSSLHDIVMPTSEQVDSLDLRNGLYQFRRAGGSPTPWLLTVFGDNYFAGLANDNGDDVALRLRDGQFRVFGPIIMAEFGDNASATIDAEDMVFTSGSISMAGGENSTALLKLTNSQMLVSGPVDIGAGGSMQIIDSTADIGLLGSDAFDVRGDLFVWGDLEAYRLSLFESGSATIAQGGVLTAEAVQVFDDATLVIAGSGANKARVFTEIAHAVGGGGEITIGNAGELRTERIIGGNFNLQAGGFLQVPAVGFEIPASELNWTGGTLQFLGDFQIDTVGELNPFGASLTVATGKTLSVIGVTGGALHIGASTQGSLTIAGGTVSSLGALVGGSIAATGPATVAVSGATGRWEVEGNLRAGGLGTAAAAISVSGGADVVIDDAHIATPGKIANVTIDGAGSTLVSSDSVFLGGDATTGGGHGTLALTNGGLIGVGEGADDQLKVWDGYTVTMNQASILTHNLVVCGTIAPAAGALITGSITALNSVVIDGGSVTLTTFGPASLGASSNVDIVAGGSLHGYIQGNAGTEVLVTGAGSSWTTPNVVATVLGTSTAGIGRIRSLQIGPGGTVHLAAGVSYAAGATDGLELFEGTLNAPTFDAGTVGVTGWGTINAVYSGGGVIQATGPLTIGNATSTSGFATTGQIAVGANTLTLKDLDAAQLGPGTILGFAGAPGTLVAANGLAVGAGETVFGYGTIDTPNDVAKRVTNDGSMSGTGTSQRLTLPGYVAGIGSFSNVEFTGTLSPGNTTLGLVTGLVSGSNYKFTETSELIMDIIGANPGFGYDVIFSTGQFIADGRLTVALGDGFVPSLGQSFDLLDFTSLIGTFDVVSLPLLGLGRKWDTSLLYTQGQIRVVAGYLEADFEEDGDVDAADLIRWRGSAGVLIGGADHGDGDADGDGRVDGQDFLIWQRQVGMVTSTGATASVPEPGAAVLASLAAFGLAMWRRR